jgi:hypothetical protein
MRYRRRHWVARRRGVRIAADPVLGSSDAPMWLHPAAHNLAALVWKARAVAAEPGGVDLALRAPVMDNPRPVRARLEAAPLGMK